MNKGYKNKIGVVTIEYIGKSKIKDGHTVNDEVCDGTYLGYKVTGPKGWTLEVGDITWDNGKRHVEVLDNHNILDHMISLPGRMRMSVENRGKNRCSIELSQARLKENNHSNLKKATLDEIDEGAKIKEGIENILKPYKIKIGTREELLDDESSRKNYLCTIFPQDQIHVPIICFTVTRILPLYHKYYE